MRRSSRLPAPTDRASQAYSRGLSRRWPCRSGSSTADSRPRDARLLRRPSSAGCRAPLAALRCGRRGGLTPMLPRRTCLRLGHTPGHWLPLLRGLAPVRYASPRSDGHCVRGRAPVALQGHPQGTAVTGAHDSRPLRKAPWPLVVRCSSGPLAAARISQAANLKLTPVSGEGTSGALKRDVEVGGSQKPPPNPRLTLTSQGNYAPPLKRPGA